MRIPRLLGQSLCIIGMLLLLAFVPFMPRVTGIPKHRILEMFVFWGSFGLLVFGSGQLLGTTPRRLNAGWQPIVASTGVLIAVLVGVLALTNLFFSSLQGIGFRPLGQHSGRLYPREVGYLLFVPLLVALGFQLPLLVLVKSAHFEPAAITWRVTRVFLLSFLVFLFIFFSFSCLLFLADRWYAVVSVGVTWFASFVVVGLAIDQIVCARWTRQ